MFKIVQLKFQNLQRSFQNFKTPIAKFTKFTTECSKFCLGGCGTPNTPPPPVESPLNLQKVKCKCFSNCSLTDKLVKS